MLDNPEPPRELVAGKYQLTELLGRGGMGSVWAGVHKTLGTRVAVKFIDAEHANGSEARARFENEARAAATLRSKHVVEVYDHGVSSDGRPFIVMEYLEGEPLDRRLDRVGRLPAKQTALLMQQVCRALTKAHAARIVHRDLKPENIFLVWDDEDGADVAKVVDFGIAKFTDGAIGASSATRTGSVLGTPYYMSPEQARGLRSVDFRTDIWSLGVIVYRAIVGILPFDGEGVGDLLVKLCTAPVPAPSAIAPDVPPGFDAFIFRALAREPEHRFQSAQEFSASLSAVCGISLRGVYGTGENPEYTGPFAASPAVATRPNSAPTVAEARGANASRAAGAPATPASGELGEAGSTGAPLSQTAPALAPRRSNALLFAGLASLAILGGGVLAVVKLLGGAPPASEAAAMSTALPPLRPAEPLVPVVPAGSAPAAPEVVPLLPASPSASASALPAVPAAAPPRPVAPAPPRVQPGITAPRPAAQVPAAQRPPAPASVPRKEIDVGY